MERDILFKDESYNIIGAAIDVYNEHKAQTINYLKATNLKLGLIINFGESRLNYERIIRY